MKFTYKQKITLAIICVLVVGYIFGCVSIRAFYMKDISYLSECMKNVLSGGTGSSVISAFTDTVLYVCLTAFLGYSMTGFVLVFPLIFFKAYMTGFYATLCYVAYGIKGGIVVAAVMMPVSLLMFMILCIVGAEAVEFSYKAICHKVEDRRTLLKRYSITCAITLVISIGLAFWSMFLTPYILKNIQGLL